MQILGAKIDDITMPEAILKIDGFLSNNSHFLTTPNPEIILYGHKHSEYRRILNNSDLALPDGIGLLLVSRLLGKPLRECVRGADMVPEICRMAREKNLKIALLGGLDQAAIQNAAAIMRGWGNTVVYAEHGVVKKDWQVPSFHEKIVKEMRACEPQILFVGFGHPKQEEWIEQYRNALPSVRLFMGCGGALDFIAGRAKRAPVWMRKIGLEWLWRLALEPKRIKRILNAVIIFPLTVIYASIRKQ